MNRQEFLATHTFADQGLEVWRRVVETIAQDKRSELLRTQKLLGLLVEHQLRTGAITKDQLDDMLMALA